ncbi:hypothetical protein [Saccharopolyspora sp. 5N708]|uniref:hypothetical protein n=1 Tax=Saccharopolyspora sp. 5N708 TaxID=3457424 RepID=UPI003FD20A8B
MFVLVAAVTVGAVIYFSQDTYRDVYLRHADRFNAIRQAFLAVSKAMPPVGQIHETACPGVPAGQHLFDHPDPQLERVVGNTVVVTQEELTNFADELPGRFDIASGSILENLIEGSDPSYQPDEHDSEWADDGYAEFVDALARTRYVVVTRVFAIDPGSATRTTFTGGSMNVEAVIADLDSHAILCTASAKAILTAEELEYRFPEGADEATQSRSARAAVENALQGTATGLLEEKLNGLGHGTFVL